MQEAPLVEVGDDVNASGALLVSCFPSVGFVSSIVAHFMVEKLDLELVGGVRHPNLPPMCLVQDGKPLPPLRFYAGEPICNMEKCDKVVLIASEIQIPSELNLPLSSGIIESLHSIFDEDPGTDSILGLGSTDSTHDVLKGIGVPLLKQGVVGGMTGVMMGECRRRGIDALAILAESDGEIGQGTIPDARAAAGIIGCLDGLLPAVHLDPEPLMEEAQRIEGQIREMMAVHLNPPQENSGASSGMYG